MIQLNDNQKRIRRIITYFSNMMELDPSWTVAIAMTESSLGEHQVSPTNCLGVFQMSPIAMEDLREEMGKPSGDDLIDIVCGLAFLRLLLKRHGSIEEATAHFCDPKDADFYIDRVQYYMDELNTNE